MYKNCLKRLLDFTISFIALLCLSPILIIISIWLYVANKGAGAFFVQERPGKNTKPIKIVKFKSMTDERDSKGKLLTDSRRLTKAGRFVRTTSIDELPQLVNVIKGDMSLVGPRPLLFHYLPYYKEEELRRHHIRPGITGLAQVNGRNNLSWDKRLAFDVYYVDNMSFMLDLKIVFMTIRNIFQLRDINIVPGETMANLDNERRTSN